MPVIRYTYEDVKKIFEKREYQLISKSYIRPTENLEYICPKGHYGSITFKNFKNRNAGCKKCVVRKPRIRKNAKNKKPEYYTIEFIKKIFEAEDYIVHTTEYKNAKTKI